MGVAVCVFVILDDVFSGERERERVIRVTKSISEIRKVSSAGNNLTQNYTV